MATLSEIYSTLSRPTQKDLSTLDFHNSPVEVDLIAGDTVTMESCYVFSAPPEYIKAVNNRTTLVKLVGKLREVTISVNKMYDPWEELDFGYVRGVPGKIQYSLTSSRLVTKHNSVLSSLYQWLELMLEAYLKKTPKDLEFNESPGVDRHYSNLGSYMFDMPFGLLVVEFTSFGDLGNHFFLENCKLNSNITQISSSVTENFSVTPTRLYPAKHFTDILKLSTNKKKFNLEGISND